MPYCNCILKTSEKHTINRRVPIEACYLKSTIITDLDKHPDCIECIQWTTQIPANAEFIECPGCNTLLLVITLRKCPLCGTEFTKEAEK